MEHRPNHSMDKEVSVVANAKFTVEAALMETSPVTGNLRLTDAGVRLVAPFLVELFKAALEQEQSGVDPHD